MNCPNCNAPVEPYDRFCEYCGSVLGTKAPAAAVPMQEEGKTPSPENAPESPYDDTATRGKHASDAAGEPYVPSAQAVAAAIAEGAAPLITNAATSDSDPYAEAVTKAGGTSSPSAGYSQPTTPPYAQPVYKQPQPTPPYAAAQPVATYADFGNATGAPTASAAGFVLAIISLVTGCIGLLTFGIFGFFGFVGIILGIIALALRSGYSKRGLYDSHAGSTLGLGIAGIITNVIAFTIFVVLVAFVAVTAESDLDSYSYDYDNPQSIEQILEDSIES